MIVTCVYVHVKRDAIDRFVEASINNHVESLKEPGNLRFDIIQQADDPCRFMFYEAYESELSAAAHKNTKHYLEWRDAVGDLMAKSRKGIKHYIVEPTDKSRW